MDVSRMAHQRKEEPEAWEDAETDQITSNNSLSEISSDESSASECDLCSETSKDSSQMLSVDSSSTSEEFSISSERRQFDTETNKLIERIQTLRDSEETDIDEKVSKDALVSNIKELVRLNRLIKDKYQTLLNKLEATDPTNIAMDAVIRGLEMQDLFYKDIGYTFIDYLVRHVYVSDDSTLELVRVHIHHIITIADEVAEEEIFREEEHKDPSRVPDGTVQAYRFTKYQGMLLEKICLIIACSSESIAKNVESSVKFALEAGYYLERLQGLSSYDFLFSPFGLMYSLVRTSVLFSTAFYSKVHASMEWHLEHLKALVLNLEKEDLCDRDKVMDAYKELSKNRQSSLENYFVRTIMQVLKKLFKSYRRKMLMYVSAVINRKYVTIFQNTKCIGNITPGKFYYPFMMGYIDYAMKLVIKSFPIAYVQEKDKINDYYSNEQNKEYYEEVEKWMCKSFNIVRKYEIAMRLFFRMLFVLDRKEEKGKDTMPYGYSKLLNLESAAILELLRYECWTIASIKARTKILLLTIG